MVHFDLNSNFSFNKLVCNGRVSYEPEIFPAALISKWRSSSKHVTLFPNGKGIITGIHRRSQAIAILQDIIVDFKSRLRQCISSSWTVKENLFKSSLLFT